MEILTLNHSPRIVGPIRYHQASFEDALIYDRRDGKRVEMALTHIPNVSGDAVRGPILQLATRKIRKGNNTPNEYIGLSMEEARLLRDFLSRPEVSAWLDEEEEA